MIGDLHLVVTRLQAAISHDVIDMHSEMISDIINIKPLTSKELWDSEL